MNIEKLNEEIEKLQTDTFEADAQKFVHDQLANLLDSPIDNQLVEKLNKLIGQINTINSILAQITRIKEEKETVLNVHPEEADEVNALYNNWLDKYYDRLNGVIAQ